MVGGSTRRQRRQHVKKESFLTVNIAKLIIITVFDFYGNI